MPPVPGQLRVGVVHALAGPVLGKTFEGIQARFPGVSLSIASGWSDDLLRSLERGDLDAVVTLSARGGGGATDGEERRVVAEDRIVVIAPRDIPVKRRASIEQLAGQQWVLSPETQCRMRARIRAAFEERGMPFKVAAEVHDFELQVSLVEQGFGLSLIPQSRIRRQLARGRLRTLALPEFDFPADVVLAASPLIGKLGAVVDEMESQLKQALRPR